MTVLEFVTATAKLAGIVARTEALAADEAADIFARLNSLLDTWQTDRLTIFSVVRTLFNLTSGVQTYTIGPGGTFNVPRPLWVQDAGIISNTNPTQPLELPMYVMSDDEWADLMIKNVPSSLSWYLYYDYAFNGSGQGNISVWPIPNVGNLQVALYLPTPIAQFATINDVFLMPPGYEEALRYNLCLRLYPEFGIPPDPIVLKIAADGMALIERANKRKQLLECDPYLISGNGRRIYNWLTDGATSRSY